MTLHWTKEDDPRWDADKQRLFGPADLAAVDLRPPAAGTPVADEWWQVTGDDGQVAGYGWLDSEWGDAQITFWVDPAGAVRASVSSSWITWRTRPPRGA